jgi:large subunit ribosomal protein L4e
LDEAPSAAVIEKLPEKTKDLLAALKSIFTNAPVEKTKAVRAGKGTLRGRKYKSNAGVLILTGAEEKLSTKTVESKPVGEVTLHDLYPLGRLTLYTKAALGDLNQETKGDKKE